MIEAITAPVLLIQGIEDAYGTLAQLDRIEARVKGPVTRLVLPIAATRPIATRRPPCSTPSPRSPGASGKPGQDKLRVVALDAAAYIVMRRRVDK